MKLPYGDKTDLQQIINKLDTYSLDFNHSSGKHKARPFESKLGITKQNMNMLITAIRNVATTSEYAQFTRLDEYGDRYVIVFDLETNRTYAKRKSDVKRKKDSSKSNGKKVYYARLLSVSVK